MAAVPAEAPLLIQATDIGVRFGDRQILNHVGLTLHAGEIVTLIGPNGAGKTTLVRIVLGLLEPHTGTVWRKPGLRIGYMPQRLAIEPTLPITVRRFLQLAAPRDSVGIEAALERLKVAHIAGAQLQSISGGELQRVLLARALLRDPQLLVLDEPAQGVDVAGQAELYQLIARISDEQHCGVLMISHDLHLVMSATDQVLCLNHHICCQGRPEKVSNDPAFLELFGPRVVRNLAVYTHHHNHTHGIDGEVIDCDHEHPHG